MRSFWDSSAAAANIDRPAEALGEDRERAFGPEVAEVDDERVGAGGSHFVEGGFRCVLLVFDGRRDLDDVEAESLAGLRDLALLVCDRAMGKQSRLTATMANFTLGILFILSPCWFSRIINSLSQPEKPEAWNKERG